MENQTLKTELNRKPTVGDSYGHGWEILKKSFLTLFLITIVVGISHSIMSIMKEHHDYSDITISVLNIFGLAFMLFVMAPIRYGAHYAFLKAVRSDEFEVKEMFSGFNNYLNAIAFSGQISWQQKHRIQISSSTSGMSSGMDKADTGH